MSRGEIQHIFDDVDSDGNGTVDIAELDLLAKYFPGESFTPELRKRLMSEIDTDGNGVIEAVDFNEYRPKLQEKLGKDKLKHLADKDGDGEIDWEEFITFDFDECLF
ncbi:calmodulin-like protein [Thalassiosira pseudonana CCMP1335]